MPTKTKKIKTIKDIKEFIKSLSDNTPVVFIGLDPVFHILEGKDFENYGVDSGKPLLLIKE